jgi:hypothetical protein
LKHDSIARAFHFAPTLPIFVPMQPTHPSSYMLSCPIKAATGIDCPGCGFQRAFADLLHADLQGAWHHYPPLFPFLLTMALLIVALTTSNTWRLRLLIGSFIFTLLTVAINYTVKMLVTYA